MKRDMGRSKTNRNKKNKEELNKKVIKERLGKKSFNIIRRDKKVISPSLTREVYFVWEKAKACYVWDIEGRKYLDFESGIAVANIGHNNDDVVKAIKDQLKKGTHAAFSDFYSELPVRFVETLLKFLPKHLNKAFLSNSGTESVEAALKLARWFTKKSRLIAFNPCFHGRTMGSLSLTNAKPVQRSYFGPFLDVKHVPYPYCYRCPFRNDEHESKECVDKYLEELEKQVKNSNIAAIFLEPIAGEPGYIVPPKEFVKGVRKIASQHGILLCVDEVQSGCFRTGKFLAIENFGVRPDIVSLSKAVGGGLPLGVTLANSNIMKWPSGAHANTFGGNLLACAAGLAALKFMRKHKLGDNARKIGNYMKKRLEEMKEKYEILGDVRGIGLMIGIEFVKDKKSKKYGEKEKEMVLLESLKQGLLMLPAGRSAIRICPPLIITKEQAEQGLNILEKSIKTVNIKLIR